MLRPLDGLTLIAGGGAAAGVRTLRTDLARIPSGVCCVCGFFDGLPTDAETGRFVDGGGV